MPSVKIVESRRFPSLQAQRAGQQDTLLVVEVDGKPENRHAITVPSANPTDAEIQAAIRDALKARDTLIGRTLNI